MMGKRFQTIAAILLSVLFAATALAAEGGNSRKGRTLYRQRCLNCHTEDSASGELDTKSKTQGQWARFFTKNKHKADPEAWDGLSDEELLHIRRYFHEFASDTDPAKCGSCWDTK